ncbi:MAG: hypothetical protein DDT30_01883 [Dehalococcoidia bacterium]|nr:hypothetical protein [Bacillota bacterium]
MKAEDVFIIRNNVIQGVAGSLIGIKVDVVDAEGSLTIEQNTITGNETAGIKLLADVDAATIQLNDITGNTVGLELAAGGTADAARNWWGDISGPKHETGNPSGMGDRVIGPVIFEPWLTRDFQTVIDDNIGYFGYAWVDLDKGWNILSTPFALNPAADTWGEFVTLGDGLAIHATSPAVRFDAKIQAWVIVTGDYILRPCDAIYVRMAAADKAPILVSPEVSVPSRLLHPGWNLVGLAHVEPMKATGALTSVWQVPGGLTGYTVVVSPPIGHQPSWIYLRGEEIADWQPGQPLPDGWMERTRGYWVFMLNEGTLAGFTFTPLPLWY